MTTRPLAVVVAFSLVLGLTGCGDEVKTAQTTPEYNKMVQDGMKGYDKGAKSGDKAGDKAKTDEKK